MNSAFPSPYRLFAQDACSKGQHIDIVVPMTHQLIEDDRLLAEAWEDFGQQPPLSDPLDCSKNMDETWMKGWIDNNFDPFFKGWINLGKL